MYFIPNKNRCNNCVGSLSSVFTYTNQINLSSENNMKNSSKVVYNNYDNKNENYKNEGNLNKHGSGGNSYQSYLQRKKGEIFCNCN